jgi:CRISPR-associated protein Csx10
MQAQAAGVQHLAPFYFAITLQSSTILCDAFLRYQKTLDAALLPSLLGLSAYTFQDVYQSVGTQCITGWNELWGTPRHNDYAIEMGSTFLFACKQQLDNDLVQALLTCKETGIGRRRSEGFGRISVSDPFHLEREQA